MSVTPPSPIDQCETESIKSDTKSIKSTASSITKVSGIRPPTTTTRIGRPCCAGHQPKPALPPPPEPKHNKMRRQSDDYSRSHLSDVFEESEADLVSERSPRSIKSKSPDSFSSKPPKSDRKISNGSTNSDLYMEATGRRHSSDQGTILTTDTDSFIIGQRIWVGGIRPGLIAYIGETHFAPGEWAGVVLDDPNGKNDGCVAGKRYFQCEPKRGIFSRLTRLTREPLAGGAMSTSDLSMNVSTRSITSPSRSGTVSPTQSMKSFSGKTPAKCNLVVGDRVIVSSGMGSRPGILQYIGETKFAPGNWCGIQLDEASGKNDGSVDGVKYFDCPAQYGIFVPLAKVSLSPSGRKPRLSRSGSKESLTSVGTLGSIASTATSRLRMSAQRISPTAKPITTPKNTFSLQEVLREKQNHIEHLLLERDLDRQDSENNTMMFQKTINQLKETIASLEKKVIGEKQKADDLQTSVDEATFCTDELNVLTQEYKDRIVALEAQLNGKDPPDGKSSFDSSKQNEEIIRLRKQIEVLTTNLIAKQSELQALEESNKTLATQIETNLSAQTASISDLNNKITELETSEGSLRDQVQYLSNQNEEIKSELRLKDEMKEEEYLNIKHVENELREEVAALQNELKLHEAAVAGSDTEIQKLIEAKDTIIAEHKEAAIGSEQLHMIIVKQKDEEITRLNASKDELQKVTESLSNEQIKLNQEIESNAGLREELQKKLDESSKLLIKFENELSVNSKLLEDSKRTIAGYESTITTFESNAKELEAKNCDLESKLTELVSINANISEGIKIAESEMRKEIQVLTETLSESNNRKSFLEAELTSRDQRIEEQESLMNDLLCKHKALTLSNESLQKELNDYKNNFENKDEAFIKLCEEVKDITNQLHEKSLVLDDFQSKFSIKEEELKDITEKSVAQNTELEHLKTSLETSVSSVTNLNAKITSLEDLHKSDLERIDHSNSELQILKSQLEVSSTDNQNLTQKLKETQNVIESSRLENERQCNVTKELKQEIDHLQIVVSTKNDQLEKINQTNAEVMVKLETSVQNGNKVQEILSKLEVEYGDLHRKQGLLEQKCEQLLLEKASLQQSLDTLQNFSSDTNSEVHRITAELQLKQRSYEELVEKSNSIQLSLEKKLHESTQNLAARTTQWEGVKNEMEAITGQKIDRENELNLELSRMKELAVEERNNLIREIDVLKASFKDEKERLIKEIDEKLQESEALRKYSNESIQKLEYTVDALRKDVEESKKEIRAKEDEFNAKLGVLSRVEEDLKMKLEESNRTESELRHSLNDVNKSGAESVEQLTMQLNEKTIHSKELQTQLEEITKIFQQTYTEHLNFNVKFQLEQKEKEELYKSHLEEKERLTGSICKLEEQFLNANSQYKLMEDEQIDLVNKNVELVQRISKLDKEVSEVSNGKCEAEDQLKKVLDELSLYKLSSEKTNSDTNCKLEKSLKQEAENLETIKLLESQNVQLNQMINANQKELVDIGTSLSAAQNEYETLKSEAATLKQLMQAQINSLQTESAENIKTIRSLEEKISQLTSSANLSDDLKNELINKSEEIKCKEKNIAELSSTVNALKEQINVRESDLHKFIEEKEVEGKRSLDVIVSKEEEIKAIKFNLETMTTSLEEKTAKISSLLNENSSILLERNSLGEELSRLNSQIKEYSEKFVDRMELNNLKEEFSIYEETKQNEISAIMTKLHVVENAMKDQSEGVDKLEIFERKQKEILYEKTILERREAQLLVENKQLSEKLLEMKAKTSPVMSIQATDNDSGAQISFLNTIIADMQRKNETLTHRIQALENAPTDFVNNGLFDLPIRRQPAPRLFCDICDEFDAHETEDCPLQSSDSPPPINLPMMTSTADLLSKEVPKERKLPPPRKYCDNCEAFGHDSSECVNEETF